MCSFPTTIAYRSQRVEAIRGGTGRPGEPSEEFRPTDPGSLQSRHLGTDSVLPIRGQRIRGGRGADVKSSGMLGKLCAKGHLLLHFPFLVTAPAAQLQREV